jgi:hypothetical protein
LPPCRRTHSRHNILERQSRRIHRLTETTKNRRTQSPVQDPNRADLTSTRSSPAPEKSTAETGKSTRGPYSLTPPPPPRRRRRKPRPRTTRTYTSDQGETSGLHHLTEARRPTEARKTAASPGVDWSAHNHLSQTRAEYSTGLDLKETHGAGILLAFFVIWIMCVWAGLENDVG